MAEFEVRPPALNEFLALASRFACECLRQEPGCRQFDVVRLDQASCNVLFYEAYDDDQAFQAHVRSTHLAAFKLAFPPLIVRELPLRTGRT